MTQPDIIDRLDDEENYVDAIDDAIAEIRRLRKIVRQSGAGVSLLMQFLMDHGDAFKPIVDELHKELERMQ